MNARAQNDKTNQLRDQCKTQNNDKKADAMSKACKKPFKVLHVLAKGIFLKV